MILKSISLRNIRSYREEHIEFPEGSILLAGDIGSGKSSILQAVEFALFGARRDSITGDALLRKGEQEGSVELAFMIDGKDVKIKRNLKRQQGAVAQDSGFVSIDGMSIEGTATELKARILDLLGYPKGLLTKSKSLVYRYTVYTPQEQMKQIISEDDEYRVDTLRKVFGIERYKRIAENATLYVRDIKEKRRELSGMIQGIDGKRSELKEKEKEISSAKTSRSALIPVLESIQSKKRICRQELISEESKVKKLNELKGWMQVRDARLGDIIKNRSRNSSEIELVSEQIVQLQKKLDSSSMEDKDYPSIDSIESMISVKEKELMRLSSRKTELTERKSQLDKRAEEIQQDLESATGNTSLMAEKERLYQALLEDLKDKRVIEGNLSELNMQLKGTERSVAHLEASRKSSEELKQKVTALQTCPTCMQDVTESHKERIITQEDLKMTRISEEHVKLLTQKEELDNMLAEHNKNMGLMQEKERKLATLKAELVGLDSVKEYVDRLKKLRIQSDDERKGIMIALEKLDDAVITELRTGIEQKKALLKEINIHNLALKEKKHNIDMISEKNNRREELQVDQLRLKEEVRCINTEKMSFSDEISGLSASEEIYMKKRQDLDRIADDEKTTEVRIGEFNKVIEGLENQAGMLMTDIRAKESANERYIRLGSVQEWIEELFINMMTTMEKQMMARVYTQFSELFSTWFNLLIDDENISVRIDDTFSPIITQNGYETDISHLSGGEKTSVALAYRLALNKVINNLITGIKTRDIIILDEPTDGFSSEQLDRVRDVLDQLDVKQTILVSHESKIESFVDNVIRVSKNEHVSKVVS
ncbi:MAG: SMC family ATPase [Candidatus Woesearchaeota archaeon]